MRRIALLLALVVPLVLVPAATTAAHDRATCATNGQRSEHLAKQATYVEYDTKTKAGTPVDRAYHTLVGIKADGSTARIMPAHYGGAHALESAYSPHNPDGYLYFADMSVLHWISVPCSAPDEYAFAATVSCARDPGLVASPCLFDAWVGLQESSDTVNWGAPWGYSHRKNASARSSCYAEGGKHLSVTWIRTWLYLDGSFTAPSPDYPFNARKSTSDHIVTAGDTHAYENGPCWPDWCDATTPPNNNTATAFTTCVV